jgi:Fe-S-cluster containining protein
MAPSSADESARHSRVDLRCRHWFSFLDLLDTEQRLTADELAISGGLNLSLRDERQLASLIRVLYEKVRLSITQQTVAPIFNFLYHNHSATLRSIAHIRLACKSGCSHCCHGWVSATAPEVFYVLRSMPPERLKGVGEAVLRANAGTEGKTTEERATINTPCSFLENHACNVYPWRPLMCRSAVSSDAQICERSCLHNSGEDIPTPQIYFTLSDGYVVALASALKKAGLQHRAFEYNAALKSALATPGAEAAWLRGENVFPTVLQDDDLFDEPWVRHIHAAAFA